MSEIKRRKGESFEGFMRRVKRQWQQSGRMIQAKKIQFHVPAKSRNVRRKLAVEKSRMLSKKTYLIKVGKLVEDELTTRKF